MKFYCKKFYFDIFLMLVSSFSGLGKVFYETSTMSYFQKQQFDFYWLSIFKINFTILKWHLQVHIIFDFSVWVPLKG